MRFFITAAFFALAAQSASAFAPKLNGVGHLQTTKLHANSHYSSLRPSFHPDARTNMNNFELDEFSGLPYEEAEELREAAYMRTQVLAEEMRQEREAQEMARFEAAEEARLKAAEERARIREEEEAQYRAMEEAREQARQEAAERLAELKAQQEEQYQAMVAASAEAEEAEEQQREITAEERTSERIKQDLSDEDKNKMVGLTGWRRMQFMDNTLDGNIIKRFPRKPPHHPDSRTNNKHIDMAEYVELTMEEYAAMREEARLEAKRLLGKSAELKARMEDERGVQRMAAVQRGKQVRETGRRVLEDEATNRIMIQKY